MTAETVDAVLISGAIGDREALDAVDPARAKADGVAGLGDVRHGVGDGVEDELDLQLGQAGAQGDALVPGEDVGVRGDLPTYVDVCSLPM